MAWKLFTPLLVVLSLLQLSTSHPSRQKCANVGTGIGYTSPPGDIILRHGVDSLDVYCHITNPDYLRKPNASGLLQFVQGTTVINGTRVVNESTLLLHVDADQLGINQSHLSCMFNDKLVCDNVVFVGTPPQPQDFRCVSYNNDNFTCSWKSNDYPYKNNYTLSYTVPNQPRKISECPGITYDYIDNRHKCVWTLTTTPQYRQSSEYYNITFTARNVLDEEYQKIIPNFHHFAHIIPNPPERLDVKSKTTSSLFIRFGIPPTIQHRLLQYRVMYMCGQRMPERVRDREFKQAVIGTTNDQAWVTYNITNLLYPHDLCDLRVSLRVNLSRDDNMWSQNATLFASTAPTVPGQGPKVNMGSFKHINDTAVRIYWQQVPAEFENGPNLNYNVTLIRGSSNVVVDRIRPMKNSAVIGNLSSNQDYTFAVYALNDIGSQSSPHALITIPAKRPYKVRELKKIENIKGFKLRWEPRLPDRQIVNYTVFWCREITKSFNEDCNGDWNWTVVSGDQKDYVYHDTSKGINSTSFRVAIASNSELSSSGMFFPTCEESGEQIPTINLIKPTEFGDTSVKLSWMAKCSTEGIANYTIEYCTAGLSDDCRNRSKQVVYVEGSVTDFIVGNLTPYATYLFTIYPTMKNGNKGKTSDPERVTTLEGKPTEPLGLAVTKVTNSTISLEWMEPSTSNGFISYDIYSNNVKVEPSVKETGYVLENLNSYDLYNITVVACTSNKCSNPSNEVSLRTLMGKPGRVGSPTAMSINATDFLIVWNKPTDPRGPVSYEIQVDDGAVNVFTNKTEKYHYKCAQQSSTFSISVRALNFDEEQNKTYYGDWSDEFKGSCSPTMSWLVPVIVVLIVIIIGTAYFSKRLYLRCKEMQNITVKLPEKLDTSVWPTQKDPNIRDSKPLTPADEELLLQSRPEGIKVPYVGDSSGCSSAQGSVTSESEGTFSAASDSGTEQSELRKRSFRNSSKTSLLGAEGGGGGNKNENYSQVGIGGITLGLNIEANPLAEMDDPKTYMQPYVDSQPITRPPEPQNSSSYVTVAQARSMPKQIEEPVNVGNKAYVQVSDLKNITQKRELPVDTNRSYVTVGQMPMQSGGKLGKHYDAKLLKED